MFKNTNLLDGYRKVNNFITRPILQSLSDEIDKYPLPQNKGGVRNAEKHFSSVRYLAQSKYIFDFASQYLPAIPKLIKATIFNKTGTNNWLVPWHQDKTIAVSSKFNRSGWLAWSVKSGIHHVQPPKGVMEQVITIRIHLDPANKDNGCLKVIPQSHECGILSQRKTKEMMDSKAAVYCEADECSALIMRPLILHSSEKGKESNSRRILHLEYSSYQLPTGIEWG